MSTKSGQADFDSFTRAKTPKELLSFMNDQWLQFDMICAANRVTKIETVGEDTMSLPRSLVVWECINAKIGTES